MSVEAADKCLKVETVQELDLDAFISKPWYGTLQNILYDTFMTPFGSKDDIE